MNTKKIARENNCCIGSYVLMFLLVTLLCFLETITKIDNRVWVVEIKYRPRNSLSVLRRQTKAASWKQYSLIS